MKISIAQAGFLKGIILVIVASIVSYLASASNLTGLLNPTMAALIAGVFSMIESQMKANSSSTKALFGAVSLTD